MDFISQKVVSSKNSACYVYQLRRFSVEGGVLNISTYKGDCIVTVPSKDLGKATTSGQNTFSVDCNVNGKLTNFTFVTNSSSSLQQWVSRIVYFYYRCYYCCFLILMNHGLIFLECYCRMC